MAEPQAKKQKTSTAEGNYLLHFFQHNAYENYSARRIHGAQCLT
jgi:hypothetical protein